MWLNEDDCFKGSGERMSEVFEILNKRSGFSGFLPEEEQRLAGVIWLF